MDLTKMMIDKFNSQDIESFIKELEFFKRNVELQKENSKTENEEKNAVAGITLINLAIFLSKELKKCKNK